METHLEKVGQKNPKPSNQKTNRLAEVIEPSPHVEELVEYGGLFLFSKCFNACLPDDDCVFGFCQPCLAKKRAEYRVLDSVQDESSKKAAKRSKRAKK